MKKIVIFASAAMLVMSLTLSAVAQNGKTDAKKETKKECCDKKDGKACDKKDGKACCDKKDAKDAKACCDKSAKKDVAAKKEVPAKK